MCEVEQLKLDLKRNLSEFRYEHSVCVAEEARKLACYYHYDEKKAYIAGLVHDIAKEFSEEENKKWIEKYRLSKEWLLPEFQNIVHAEIGACVVSEWYGLDEEICNAVRYHTIGNTSMTLLEKIIFVADKVGRKANNLEQEEIRKVAYQDINRALYLCLKRQKEKLEQSGKIMHPNSIQLIKYLKKRTK